MNKGLSVTLITLLSILLVFLVGIMIFLFNGKISFDGFNIATGYSKKLVEEKEINNIKDLNISTDIADVSVEEKDINNIKVELYSEKKPIYEITENAGSIKIVLKQKDKVHFGIFNKFPRIVVYVPTTFNKDVKVEGTTSDVKIGNFPNSDLNVKATTGDVKVKKISNAKINLTTGDIKIGSVNKSLVLETNTGDVRIDSANLLVNSNITTGTGDVDIDSIKGCYVEGSTKTGDTNINNSNEDRKSDIILKIKTRVGDINVN